ncbi:cation diffusion facilitator family transporter [Ketobacter sp.]|uniref:cation diffusion facilitator family transporter n=1 Tax=Ketobacter sp. TaxID=2083498 RepID=UPI000F21BA62|nr:cation diffusion facilitator family transporter [Ketobacter sp.]RLU00132.1 MAG: cation diffusion facilitator family transporter [Ketobacter sp.]
MTSAYSTQASEQRLLKLAASASVLTAVILLVVKAYAWWVSGSVSVLASLADSTIDALASCVNFLAVRYALQPADAEHRFGHGKAESLAGLGQSLLIMGSAIYLLVQAIDRMLHPQPLQQLDVAVGVMGFSIVATLCLVLYQRWVVSKTHSVAIKADSLHYVSDLLTNLGIVVALILSQLGWNQFDPLLAIAISVYIFYTAIMIWNESIQHLLDRELPEDEQQKIVNIALSHVEVLGVHELRTRQSGRVKIIQLHLELDGNMPLWQAHDICDEVEREIREAFPAADVLLHQDPFRADPDARPIRRSKSIRALRASKYPAR